MVTRQLRARESWTLVLVGLAAWAGVPRKQADVLGRGNLTAVERTALESHAGTACSRSRRANVRGTASSTAFSSGTGGARSTAHRSRLRRHLSAPEVVAGPLYFSDNPATGFDMPPAASHCGDVDPAGLRQPDRRPPTSTWCGCLLRAERVSSARSRDSLCSRASRTSAMMYRVAALPSRVLWVALALMGSGGAQVLAGMVSSLAWQLFFLLTTMFTAGAAVLISGKKNSRLLFSNDPR